MSIKLASLVNVYLILGLSFSFNFSHAQADEYSKNNPSLGRTNIEFYAKLFEPACKISSQSQNMVIDLGDWNTKDFTEAGSKSRRIPFHIIFEECNASFLSVAIQGEADPFNNQYLKLNKSSTVKNIAIQIFEKDDVLLPLNQFTQKASVVDEKAVVVLFANFISTADQVTAGQATADATLMIKYE